MNTEITPIDRFPLGFRILQLRDETRRLLEENGSVALRQLIGASLARHPRDELEIQKLVEQIVGGDHLFDLTNAVLHESKDLWWEPFGEFTLRN